ncbi:MAG: HlyC/CorC family transporter, partial [Lactobacillus helsingborgensis]|nr:HlyC/CorC family transporter [Lactobacillus helsingborgensis]
MTSDPEKGNLFERFRNKFSPTNDEETREHLISEIEDLHQQKKINDNEFSMLNAVLDFQGRMVR